MPLIEPWVPVQKDEYETLKRERDMLRAEIGRLTHLHKLDHGLADQRGVEVERLQGQIEAARAALKGADTAGMALVNETERLRAAAVTGIRLHRDTQPFDGTPLSYVVVSIEWEGEWREVIRALADNDFDDAIYTW